MHRRTVSRWLQSDPHFAAAYNAWRKETITSARARVLAMADLALDTMQSAIQQGDARIAVQIAKAAGALEPQTPGPADPKHLERRRELHAERQKLALDAAEKQLKIDRGEDPDRDWHRTPREIERTIEFLLEERRKALKTETPEQRTERLSWYETRRRSNPIEFVRLLELSDATIAAEADGSLDHLRLLRPHCTAGSVFYEALYAASVTGNPVKVGSDEHDILQIPPGTPPEALPAAPPLATPVPWSPPLPSAPPPKPPPAPPPSVKSLPAPLPPPPQRSIPFTVRYDGSDDDDNDPMWRRIG